MFSLIENRGILHEVTWHSRQNLQGEIQEEQKRLHGESLQTRTEEITPAVPLRPCFLVSAAQGVHVVDDTPDHITGQGCFAVKDQSVARFPDCQSISRTTSRCTSSGRCSSLHRIHGRLNSLDWVEMPSRFQTPIPLGH
ncbi:hypothetical protein SETIT_7G301400v2 [Setaria italica]|uniref:Uncharacterized protein n=1 Tax=Setaria italica TaxID=4555 RepID=A0A368S1E3_SETIT|nr:hypothetical protein SETIT_7G301400v2 [Setaria italica]